jgi:AraC-like DNA-binding protein
MPTHLLLETHDHAEMVETMRGVYGAGLRMEKPTEALAFRQEVLIDDGVTLGQMEIGAEMGVGQEGFADFAMARLRSGNYMFHRRDDLEIRRGESFIMPPEVKLRAHIHTPFIDVVQISPAEILRTIFELYPFARSAPLETVTTLPDEASQVWWASAAAYARVLSTPEFYENEMIRRTGWNHLLALSVQLFGLVRQGPGRSGSESVVHRSEAFIDEHLDQPLTVPMIAAAVAVSPRTLHLAFQQRREYTPSGYVRKARLDAVRRDLRSADASVTTVAAVARRWGFGNPGRFAAQYRAEFGRNPSTDLGR